MLKNHFKSAIRDFANNKFYWILNAFGLAVGVAVSLLLFQYVRYEFSYDRFYEHSDQIFRVEKNMEQSDGPLYKTTRTAYLLAEALKEEISQIEMAGSIQFTSATFEFDAKRINEDKLYFAQNDLLKILEFKFIEGSIEGQLEKPNTIVLTKSLANKIFGTHINLIGKSLRTINGFGSNRGFDAQVTGVIEDLPANSHLKSTGFISASTIDSRNLNTWVLDNFSTYVKLRSDADVNQVTDLMEGLIRKHPINREGDFRKVLGYGLFPISDIYLSTDPIQFGAGNKKTVITFSVFGLLILLIACTNYMNLATARYTQRSRHIGIRKVVGAQRKQIIGQILTESILISLLALFMGGLLAEIGSVVFNSITDKPIAIGFMDNPLLLVSFAIFTLMVGVVSGSYPALQLSKINVSSAIKGSLAGGKKGQTLRRALVLFQFVVSGGLIISTLVIYMQMQFVTNKDLGFNPENVMTIGLPRDNSKAEMFRNELSQNPTIESQSVNTGFYHVRKLNFIKASNEAVEIRTRCTQIDNDFLREMGYTLLQGREFNKVSKSGQKEVLVNETLVAQMGWVNPLEHTIGIYNYETQQADEQARIIGVVKDFNENGSLLTPISPFVFFHLSDFPTGQEWLHIKLNEVSGDVMNFVKTSFEEADPGSIYNASFLEDRIASLYASDRTRGKVHLALTIVAIFVACLGLFGLAFFSVKVRTKEIAIRKVLGSSLIGIVKVLSREFIIIVTIASALAFPIATILMRKWLETFAYRINIGTEIFLLAIFATVSIAFISVAYQSFTTTRINPAQILKNE